MLAIKEKSRIKFTHLSKAVKVSKKFIRKFNKAGYITSIYG